MLDTECSIARVCVGGNEQSAMGQVISQDLRKLWIRWVFLPQSQCAASRGPEVAEKNTKALCSLFPIATVFPKNIFFRM